MYPSTTLIYASLIKSKYKFLSSIKNFYLGKEYVGLLNEKGEMVFHLLGTFGVYNFHLTPVDIMINLDSFFMKSITELKFMV